MKIHLICAARPNFMKIAPLYHALKKEPWARPVIVHTGQHYDINMSDAFFVDLGLPAPDINLDVRNGSHAQQTGKVMIAYEELLIDQRPDLVVVVGDVNSTMAATLAATKVVYPNPGLILNPDSRYLSGSPKPESEARFLSRSRKPEAGSPVDHVDRWWPIWRPVCGPSIAPCPKSSTGWSPTSWPTSSGRHRGMPTRTSPGGNCAGEDPAGGQHHDRFPRNVEG